MRHFKNFKTCVYCTAQTLASLDETTLARDYAYLEKYVGIDKVYLETYRDGTWVAIDHMKMIQNFCKISGSFSAACVRKTFSESVGKSGTGSKGIPCMPR